MMWIDTDVALNALIDEVVVSDRYALDTEFHREKTYYPKLALLQIRIGESTALVDPLAVDTTLLVRLFEADSLCVVHAAQQDLEVLQHASGAIPKRIFDTQLSSGFIGMSTPSLASLVQNELKISLPKGDRLTDWLRRPLTADQQKYAASDVEILRKVRVPNAVPYLFTALKISAPAAVITSFVSEYFGGSQNGLGSRITSNIANSKNAAAWAYVLGACLLGLVFYIVSVVLENVASRGAGATNNTNK